MKKQILMAGLFVITTIACTTRSNAQKGFSFGLEGAPQLTWLRNTDDLANNNYEKKDNLNAMFGINTHYGFTDRIGLGLNASYSFQGQRYKINDLECIRKVEYLKVPVLFTYSYAFNPDFMVMGKIGPQLGILTKAALTDKNGNNLVNDQQKAYADYDLGGMASVSTGFRFTGNFYFDAGLRFDYGFTNAEDKDHNLNINNPSITENNYNSGEEGRAMTNNITAGVLVGIRYVLQ